jgi:periplasmic glucans biosynthesis protein
MRGGGRGRRGIPVGARVMVALAALQISALAQAEPQLARDGAFDGKMVEQMAKALADSPFTTPKSPLPKALAGLSYDQYRDIRFLPSATVWADGGRRFRLQWLHRGFLFTDPVEIAIVSRGKAKHVVYSPSQFSTGKVMSAPLPDQDIGFSGFRILSPLNRPDGFDEIAVFQGASYFRSLGRNQVYGVSARGLAIKTGDPSGEEFPSFRAFWIEEPALSSGALLVHALLDSPSTAGAYHFTIVPGRAVQMEVEAVLFPRGELGKVGLAPGTSMFMFSPNGRSGADDFRPEVHDSDGLLIVNGRGEHLWRPLANPKELQISAFADKSPAGFGLLQRDRNVADYQDFEAHYEMRPNLWVEPVGDWGEGSVELTEIPSNSEIHDNIVAFWHPRAAIPAHTEYRFAYRLSWGDVPRPDPERAQIVATRRGRADVRNPTPVRLFAIDYTRPGPKGESSPRPRRRAGAIPFRRIAEFSAPGDVGWILDAKRGLSRELPHATVSASAGEIRDVVVADNPLTGGFRVSFVFDPKQTKVSELRADLEFTSKRRAETWVYRWTEP